ncbi:hypothetical protein B7R54_08665 [Subtercola boreus]|uniref:OmpR/PhoB-type domain-containing protein n=1 Tax=Subtercola boreus TaxID=120213 RepID=A0A3E0VIG8_9MICO|nr:AAA family ATPase [Subtercola boreus]RFA09293.1 hypothetical protein B7R54_08665 [Subtercola boreus]TQL53679.1 putative ATPase [Subtercola boreus]
MRIALLGGLRVEHEGRPIAVSGTMQLAVLFRLTVDAGTAVSYRAIAEDVWGLDAPQNTRAALQSIVSRLRSQLPDGSIESTTGGYRLNLRREDVDALVFTDLVDRAAGGGADAGPNALRALELWAGEPWIPSPNFDWFLRDLSRDHALAVQVRGADVAVRQDSAIPAPLTSLVGREAELHAIAEQLTGNRLVTIIGTGGAGKTRLAIETAAHRGNALLVELAPVGPSEVLGAVLTATGRELRTAETTGESSRTRILEALAGRDVLLVLDNCEHVIDAAAALSEDLLASLPRLRILATSREPLGVPGEAFVGLGSLPHPEDERIGSATSADLAAFPAVELFCQRAQSARGRPLESDEVVLAARICTRLDGLPLAIELAAAKLRTMEPGEILSGLDDRFTLLAGGYRTGIPHHQTLKAMIDWSWSLLDEVERRALLALSVFPAGVGVVEARSLATALGLPDAAVFDSLVDRSLLQRTRGRFRELETIREYGIERALEAGTLAEARAAQAGYMMERAADFDRMLRGPRLLEGVAWFDDEEDNLASALRHAAGLPLPEVLVRLTVSSLWYWVLRDRNEDAVNWLRSAAAAATEVEGDEAKILSLVLPLLENFSGNDTDHFDAAVLGGHLHDLLEPLRSIELGPGSHELLQLLGPSLLAFAEVATDADWFAAVRLPRGEELGLDTWPTAVLHVMRAGAAQNRGAVDELGAESEIALDMLAEVGDRWGSAFAQRMRAEWLTLQGRLEEALELADASTGAMRAIASATDFAREQGLSIHLLWRLGRSDEARARVERIVAETDSGGDPRAVIQVLVNALLLDVAVRDVAAAGIRVGKIDELVAHSTLPLQTVAVLETAKAALARELGDFDGAEQHLRTAAESSLQSRDQPIIGSVAIGAGMLALARGDVETAVRAADFASAVIGAYDATHPDLMAISAAADSAGIGRPATGVTARPESVGVLRDLLG